MNKYVVISVNENPQYIFYLPLTIWAWKKLGWEPLIFRAEATPALYLAFGYINERFTNVAKFDVHGYKTETLAQISRLYAASLYGNDEDYIMTSDVDMLPLSDYWKFNPDDITVWGHNLTGYNQMPICYIGMKRTRWVEVMSLTSHRYNDLIKRDLDKMANARSSNFEEWWTVDQQLITERINGVQFKKNFIHRAEGANGYPVGRVDRSAWSLNHHEFIDAHLLRDIYSNSNHLEMTMELLRKVWPDEKFEWFREYASDYANILKA